jgi:hypothetical protein
VAVRGERGTEGCELSTIFVAVDGLPADFQASVGYGMDAKTFDIREGLDGGGGQIETSDPELISALSEHPAVTLVPTPPPPPLELSATADGLTATLTVGGASGNGWIDWGDGQIVQTVTEDVFAGPFEHDYAAPGEWQIIVASGNAQQATTVTTSGAPGAVPTREELEASTIPELHSYMDAQQPPIPHTSSMNKGDLVDAILAPHPNPSGS